ncbi:hypothetical protein CEE60_12975 [Stenotrophomonas maltophilia]|uniref:DUF1254 domain-containing protein n=1 Tax=Stenotrophomonas maltophilia TaxID=40324 RepID=A0A246HKG9_STEMA|nr:DUF1254 domain-containing protein [Stenotrophomonas maltophilia]OWQ52230.1 hypothetical protein CEE60_12975 [Stenotrophomonas maltophilia]
MHNVAHTSTQVEIAGPVKGTRLTEAYVRMVARNAYFWAWPMVNIYNRRLKFKDLPEPGLMGGFVPVAPLNHVCMLSDYIGPQERMVACPNQDVVYGAGSIGLDVEPVVLQVPDFGERFWVYQVVDLRSDSFADIGKMYGTAPGFYLLVGPDWHGDVPAGITRVFRSSSKTGFVIPRVFLDDTPQDRQAILPLINQIDMYPLSAFDGTPKQRDWARVARFPADESQGNSGGEAQWVIPATFVDELPLVLDDASPLPGEQALYAELRAVVEAARQNPELKRAMTDEVGKAEEDLVGPLLQFRNYGLPLPHHWTTQRNGAAFGTDYYTRTAVAKSNIFVNKPNETKYFYQDLDDAGQRLEGSSRYTVTFPAGQLPPVQGFWSLTLYNQHHFFSPNAIERYSVGTKNKTLIANPDGSLTIYVQADAPSDPVQKANWLPAPEGEAFSLYIRAYWPQPAVTDGSWTPPPVRVAG